MRNSLGSIKRIGSYIKPYKIGFIVALLLTVICMFANALQPFIMGLILTEVGHNVADIANGVAGAAINFPYVIEIIIYMLIIALVYQITMYASAWLMTNVVQNTMRDLRADIDNKINRLPVSYFDKNQQGNILSRVTNDVDAISNAMQQSLIQIVNSVLGIVFAVGMMLVLSIPLALILIVTIPVSILISKFVVNKSQPYFKGQQKSLGELNGYVQESFSGFSVIKLYGKEADTLKEFKEINHRLASFGFKAKIYFWHYDAFSWFSFQSWLYWSSCFWWICSYSRNSNFR